MFGVWRLISREKTIFAITTNKHTNKKSSNRNKFFLHIFFWQKNLEKKVWRSIPLLFDYERTTTTTTNIVYTRRWSNANFFSLLLLLFSCIFFSVCCYITEIIYIYIKKTKKKRNKRRPYPSERILPCGGLKIYIYIPVLQSFVRLLLFFCCCVP